MTRKFLTIFLLFIFSFAFLISCSGGEESFEVEITSDFTFDFDGDIFTIVAYDRYGRIELDPFREAENNYWSEKLIGRYHEIEEKYNLDIEIKLNDGGINASIAANLPWAEIFDGWLNTIDSYLNAGFLVPLNEIDGFIDSIDSGKWGSEASLETFKRADDYYGFRAGFWGIPFPAFSGIIYANTSLMRAYDIPVIEMIENGEWLWSNFEAACMKIGGSYDNPDEPVGFVLDSSWGDYFMRAAIMSNGGEMAKINSDGRYVYNMNSPQVIEALEWVYSLKQNLGFSVVGGGEFISESGGRYFPRFQDNLLGFLCQYSYVGTIDLSGFMYNDVDFYMLPFPCGPSGTYGEWGSYISFADRYLTVPLTADMDKINAVFDDLFAPFEGETEFSWKELYTTYMFINEESAKYYFEMFDTARSDFNQMSNLFDWYGVLNGTKTVTAAVEAIETQAQTVLDRYYNVYFD